MLVMAGLGLDVERDGGGLVGGRARDSGDDVESVAGKGICGGIGMEVVEVEAKDGIDGIDGVDGVDVIDVIDGVDGIDLVGRELMELAFLREEK